MSLFQALVGNASAIDSSLDSLFKSSIAPGPLVSRPIATSASSAPAASVNDDGKGKKKKKNKTTSANSDTQTKTDEPARKSDDKSHKLKRKRAEEESSSQEDPKDPESQPKKQQKNQKTRKTATQDETDSSAQAGDASSGKLKKRSKLETEGEGENEAEEKKGKKKKNKQSQQGTEEQSIEKDDEVDKDQEERKGKKKKGKSTQKETASTEETGDTEMNDVEEDDAEEKKKIENDPERLARSVFVGNVPVEVAQKKAPLKEFRTLFSQCGEIESLRFRSIAFAKIINRKIAFKGKMFHPERDTCNCYIVYEDAEALEEAAKLNGTVFMGKHLRVDRATSSKESYDTKRAVFLGNLPFDVAEEDIWTFFEERVGEVEYVRVIRDSVTNVGKGFGYVGFKDRASVGLALKLNEQEFKERQLRVERCSKRLSQGQKNAPASSRRQPVRLPKLKGKKQNPAVARIQAKKKKMKRK